MNSFYLIIPGLCFINGHHDSLEDWPLSITKEEAMTLVTMGSVQDIHVPACGVQVILDPSFTFAQDGSIRCNIGTYAFTSLVFKTWLLSARVGGTITQNCSDYLYKKENQIKYMS